VFVDGASTNQEALQRLWSTAPPSCPSTAAAVVV
jgi:hypothetical protein